jgi:NhaP-type Na+/H+ or K+/H+ antiporter/Trk K+ transport system NAD-binding subunit
VASNPGLTVAIALAAGVVAQSIARHLSIPGIVLLLGTGVLLGPEFADVVQPASLGPALPTLVGFAIAVILFEGGLNLDVRRLRREGRVIRRLVTVGAIVTAVGATVAARALMGWGWRESTLFGVLVIVTGPTVVTPLVRRIGLARNLRTVLEAEGVFIDAVGALVAVVTLEIVVQPGGQALLAGAASLGLRLGFGLVAGLAGGILMALPLRVGPAVPEGLENVLTLSLVVALFQASNAILPESGILAVIIAGVVVGNVKTHAQRSLLEFKEQLTVMLVGMLFVLLAADVRLYQVHDLGVPGLLTVGALMLLVRPATVLASTAGAPLSWREKAFLSWLAPRGIVAAAVASLFQQSMTAAGLAGGREIRALVFLVIAATVVLQGLTGGLVASLLGLRRRMDAGWVIVGAHGLGRALGRALRDTGEEAVLVDSDPDAVRSAGEEGFRTVFGGQLERRTLLRSEPDTRRGYVALTAREGVNLLFARKVREEYKVARVLVALDRTRGEVEPGHAREAGCVTLFGAKRDLGPWIARCEAGAAETARWRAGEPPKGGERTPLQDSPEELLLPLVAIRGDDAAPVDEATRVRAGDEVVWLVSADRAAEARAWLEARGWQPARGGEGGETAAARDRVA